MYRSINEHTAKRVGLSFGSNVNCFTYMRRKATGHAAKAIYKHFPSEPTAVATSSHTFFLPMSCSFHSVGHTVFRPPQ